MQNGTISRARRRAGLLAIGVVGLGLALAACDGGNAFAPVGVGPSLVQLTAPEQVQEGASFEVRARAVAAVRVDSIVVTIQGAIEARQVEQNVRRDSDVTFLFDFSAPAIATSNEATITAFAVDAQGNVSPPRVVTVRLLDGTAPQVQVIPGVDTVAQGESVPLTVTASDNMALARVGVEVRGPSGGVVFADSVAAAGASASTTFTWNIPVFPTFGDYSVSAFAVDASGNRGTAAGATVTVRFVDQDDPVVDILMPTSTGTVIAAGDSVRVQARVLDNDAITLVRFRAIALLEAGGVGAADTISRFMPREIVYEEDADVSDVTVSRYLRFDFQSLLRAAPSGAQEPLLLIVEAVDRSGRVGADTLTVTLAHDVVPPRVNILTPADGTAYFVADTLPIPISFTVADDQGPIRTGVTAITVEVKQLVAVAGGNVDDADLAPPRSFSLQDAGQLTPIVAPRTFDYVIPGLTRDTDAADRFFFVIVTAQDAAGLVGADTLRLVSLGPPPEPEEPDPAPPVANGAGLLAGSGVLRSQGQPWRPEEEN